MLVVWMLSGKPIRLRVVHPPTFFLPFPTFSLVHSIGFCLSPPFVCCFVDNEVLSIGSLCLTPSKMFEIQYYQTVAHCQ